MIAFKVWRGSLKIDQFEYEKETEHFFVLAKNRRQAKSSTYENSFHSWDEAKAFIVGMAEKRLATAKQNLDMARSHLESAKAIKP